VPEIDWRLLLSVGSDLAQVVTGVVAFALGVRFLWRGRRRRLALEAYLKAEREADERDNRSGLRTITHLVAHVAMTEAQILEAAFASRRVQFMTAADEDTGRASALFLRHQEPKRRGKFS
jgi:hypothetical protein